MKLNPFAVMRKSPDGSGTLFDPSSNKALKLNVRLAPKTGQLDLV